MKLYIVRHNGNQAELFYGAEAAANARYDALVAAGVPDVYLMRSENVKLLRKP